MTRLSLIALAGVLLIAGCVPAAREPATAPAPRASAPAPAAPLDAPSGDNPRVGGVAMVATRTIAENAAAAPNLTTFVTALKAAGLTGTLSAPGTFTVFAPTNDAFASLAPGTVDRLLSPENATSLSKILKYHVISGDVGADRLRAMIASGGGTATLTTIEGSTLTARLEGAAIALMDANGTKSYVETPDVRQSNGVIHVINGVAVPKLD